jgi:hypothetical protein
MCALKSRNELTLAGSQPYLSKTCLGQCLNLTCCVEHIMCTCNVIPYTRKSSLNTSEGRIRDTSRLLQLAALYATMQPRTFHNLHCIWGTSLYFSVWTSYFNARRGSSEAQSEPLYWRSLRLVEGHRYRHAMIRGT